MADSPKTHETPPSGAFLYAHGPFNVRTEETAAEIDSMLAEPGPFIVLRVTRSLGGEQGPFVTDLVRVRKKEIIAYG